MNAPTPLRYLLPAPSRAAIERAVGVGLDSLRALPPMQLSDWAAKHFRLAGESSQQRGGWEAWPFQVGMLDAMSNDDSAELDVFKSKRVGYTKALVASIAFDAAHRRRNQALWQPTDDDRDSFVKSEIEPLLDPETGARFWREILAVGGSRPALDSFKAFRGREPKVDALLRHSGMVAQA